MKSILYAISALILFSFTSVFKKEVPVPYMKKGYNTIPEYTFNAKMKEAKYLKVKAEVMEIQNRLELKYNIKD